MERCLICNKELKNKVELSKHINKSHSGIENYYLKTLNNKRGACKICGKNTEFINIWSGYKNTCSNKKCINQYSKIKRESTNLKKYGTKFPSSLNNIKEKISVANKIKSEESSKKRENTNLKKYGVKNPWKSKIIQDKIKNTNLKKYGNKIPSKTDEIKDKIKKTNNLRYGGNSPQSDPNVFKKSQNKKKLKYNDPNYNNVEKSQKTLLEKTGFRHALQNPSSYDKYKNTSLIKYGTEHPMQNNEIFKKSLESGFKSIRYKDTNIFYQGSFELDFLDNFFDKIYITRGPRIEYFYNNQKHYYFPDFYIKSKNLIVEIKSEYWNNIHQKINNIKMEYCIKNGYNFILIKDKKYKLFRTLINR
jgi:hypothetical protein